MKHYISSIFHSNFENWLNSQISFNNDIIILLVEGESLSERATYIIQLLFESKADFNIGLIEDDKRNKLQEITGDNILPQFIRDGKSIGSGMVIEQYLKTTQLTKKKDIKIYRFTKNSISLNNVQDRKQNDSIWNIVSLKKDIYGCATCGGIKFYHNGKLSTIQKENSWVNCLAKHDDYFFYCLNSGEIVKYSLSSENQKRLKISNNWINCIIIYKNLLFAGDSKGVLFILDPNELKLIKYSKITNGEIWSLNFIDNGILFCGTSKGEVIKLNSNLTILSNCLNLDSGVVKLLKYKNQLIPITVLGKIFNIKKECSFNLSFHFEGRVWDALVLDDCLYCTNSNNQLLTINLINNEISKINLSTTPTSIYYNNSQIIVGTIEGNIKVFDIDEITSDNTRS